MWRPNDWENLYPDKRSFIAQRSAFEAGADAMLEAIYKQEEHTGKVWEVIATILAPGKKW